MKQWIGARAFERCNVNLEAQATLVLSRWIASRVKRLKHNLNVEHGERRVRCPESVKSN